MKLAEIFVAVRPDDRQLPADMRKALGKVDTDRLGKQAGKQYSDAFGSGLKKLAGVAGAALAGAAIGQKVKESISAASDLNETVSKTQQVFGKSAAAIQAFADKAPTALGQTRQAALDANATFGLFGKSAGLTGQKLVGFTTNLTTLAGDLASFNNTTPEQAIDALGAALRGESEPIRSYGVLLDDATLKAEAMSLGLLKPTKNFAEIKVAQNRAMLAQIAYNKAVKDHGKGSTEALRAQTSLAAATNTLGKKTSGTVGPLTQQQKVLAAQSAIMKQTTTAQGDFARTSSGLANQQRIAAAQTDKLKVALGTALLPVVLQGATALNAKLLPPLIELADRYGPKLGAALTDLGEKAGPFLHDFLEKAGPLFTSFSDGTNEASPALTSLADSGAKLGPVISDLITQIPSLTNLLNVGATVIAFFADHTDELSKLMPLIVAGVIAYKIAQAAANVVQLLSIPTKVAEVVVNRQLVASNKALIASRTGVVASTTAETISTGGNTVAKNVNAVATARGRAATIAASIAQKAATITTTVLSGALRLMGLAVTIAMGPVGLIILAVAALALGFIVLWKRSETFRTIVTGVLNNFKTVALTVITFVWKLISGFFGNLLQGAAKAFGWVPGLGDKLKGAAAAFGDFTASVNRTLDGLKDQSVTVKPVFDTKSLGQNPLMKNNFATGGKPGGKLLGAGTPTSDNIPVMASPTEWIIKGRSSSFYGDKRMAAVNNGTARILLPGEVPGFATGGRPGLSVRTPMPNTSAFAKEVAAHSVQLAKPFAQQIANQFYAGPGGPPGARKSYRGVQLNTRTIRMLLTAEKILGRIFHITQGSYSTSVAASGGTHAGGGAMDTNGPGGWGPAVNALRRAGFAAWHRSPSQGPWGHHIHSIGLGDSSASPSAKAQMAAYKRGGDGLGHGMRDGGSVRDFIKTIKFDSGQGRLQPGMNHVWNGTGAPEPLTRTDRAMDLSPDTLRAMADMNKKALVAAINDGRFRLVSTGAGGSYILQNTNG